LAIYEVTDVALRPERTERLLGFNIDAPHAGTKHNVYTLHLIGWVVARDAQAISLEVYNRGELIRSVPVRGPRTDVAGAIGVSPETDCVFHALVGLIGLQLDATLELLVTLSDGSSVAVGSVQINRKPLQPDYDPRLDPIVVSTLGRSGSTWLMQLLASHPEIVVFRHFPYESSAAKYWVHMLRVAGEPVNIVQSGGPKTSHTNIWWLGNNPHHNDRAYEHHWLADWFGREHLEQLAAFCQRTIDEWYLTLAKANVQLGATFFAEKHVRPNYQPTLIHELYPRAKEIFLVRDFRDMARSIITFDSKRGFAGFDRPNGVGDEDYVRGELRQMAEELAQSWEARAHKAHLVRYEDLVYEPTETVAGMLHYLGVDASETTVQTVLAKGAEQVLDLPASVYSLTEIQEHRTIADPKDTIGRWRRDGDEAFQALAQESFGQALTAFGYS
jgi:Sulfotransferase family